MVTADDSWVSNRAAETTRITVSAGQFETQLPLAVTIIRD